MSARTASVPTDAELLEAAKVLGYTHAANVALRPPGRMPVWLARLEAEVEANKVVAADEAAMDILRTEARRRNRLAAKQRRAYPLVAANGKRVAALLKMDGGGNWRPR